MSQPRPDFQEPLELKKHQLSVDTTMTYEPLKDKAGKVYPKEPKVPKHHTSPVGEWHLRRSKTINEIIFSGPVPFKTCDAKVVPLALTEEELKALELTEPGPLDSPKEKPKP